MSTVSQIVLERDPPADELRRRGVFDWPQWAHGPDTFPWTYDEDEDCYLLEGEVVVTPDAGAGPSVTLRAGDYVSFPRGLSCTWEIKSAVRKHYRMR